MEERRCAVDVAQRGLRALRNSRMGDRRHGTTGEGVKGAGVSWVNWLQ